MSKCPLAVIFCVLASGLATAAYILPNWQTISLEEEDEGTEMYMQTHFGLTGIGMDYEICEEGEECVYYSILQEHDDPENECEEREDETEEQKEKREDCEVRLQTAEYSKYGMYGALGFALISTILIVLSNFGFLPNWIPMITIYILCLSLMASALYFFLMFPALSDGEITWGGDDARIKQNPGLSIWLALGGSIFALVSGIMVKMADDDDYW